MRFTLLLLATLAWAPDTTRVDLAGAEWTANGRPPDAAPAVADGCAVLPIGATGVRWATVFVTEEPGTARLWLTWRGAPDGLLYEVVVDGRRLPPPRDAWRPSERPLQHDLGPAWLGRGEHLIEFVARESPIGEAALRPGALELRWL